MSCREKDIKTALQSRMIVLKTDLKQKSLANRGFFVIYVFQLRLYTLNQQP